MIAKDIEAYLYYIRLSLVRVVDKLEDVRAAKDTSNTSLVKDLVDVAASRRV